MRAKTSNLGYGERFRRGGAGRDILFILKESHFPSVPLYLNVVQAVLVRMPRLSEISRRKSHLSIPASILVLAEFRSGVA